MEIRVEQVQPETLDSLVLLASREVPELLDLRVALDGRDLPDLPVPRELE
jgi:hypothetical protein